LRSAGVPEDEAIRRAAADRYRPVIMTTITAIVGMLPLALFGGPGVELRRSIAVVVIGGLATATIGTLVLIPLLPRALEPLPRRWVVPIEGALRAAGDTTGTRGEVEAGSATIVARFKRGTDVELKAARLASDLAALRARLPDRATLSVFPARGGVRPNAVFAVTGAAAGDAAARIAEQLRSTPGVRDV